MTGDETMIQAHIEAELAGKRDAVPRSKKSSGRRDCANGSRDEEAPSEKAENCGDAGLDCCLFYQAST